MYTNYKTSKHIFCTTQNKAFFNFLDTEKIPHYNTPYNYIQMNETDINYTSIHGLYTIVDKICKTNTVKIFPLKLKVLRKQHSILKYIYRSRNK